jgi:hypothetical protein
VIADLSLVREEAVLVGVEARIAVCTEPAALSALTAFVSDAGKKMAKMRTKVK